MKAKVILMLAAVAALLSSCSKSSATMEVVPEDVDMVAVMDFKAGTELFGVEVTSDDIKFPKDFPADEVPADVKNVLVRAYNAVDMSSVVYFVQGLDSETSSPNFYLVASITDETKLTDLLRKDIEAEKSTDGGMTCYELNSDAKVYLNDGLVWFTSGDAADIKKVLKDASSGCFFDGKVASAQKPEGMYSVYVNAGVMGKMMNQYAYYLNSMGRMVISTMADYLSDKWVIATCTASEKEATAHVIACDSDGKVLEVPMLKDIDTDFLAFVPENYNSVLAGALNDEALKYVKTAYDAYLSDMVPAQSLSKLVDGLEGTFFGAMDMDFKAKDMPGFIAGIKLKSGAASNALSAIAELAGSAVPDENMLVTPSSIKIDVPYTGVFTFSVQGNYLLVSNEASTTTGNKQLKDFVAGHLLALGLNLPDLSDIVRGWDFGGVINAYLDSKSFTYTIKYDKPISQLFATMCETLVKQSHSSRADWDYDYYDEYATDSIATKVVDWAEVEEMPDSIMW